MYSNTLHKRIIKGLGANVIGQALNFIQKIILTPLFISYWGTEQYGDWLLITSFMAYLSLTELGGQVYIVNKLTQYYAEKQHLKYNEMLHSGVIVFLLLPLVALSILVPGLIFTNPNDYLNLSVYYDENYLKSTLLVVALLFLFSIPQGLIVGVYRTVGLLHKSVMLGNLILVQQIILVSILLLNEGTMFSIAIVQVVSIVSVSLYAVYDLNKSFPDVRVFSLDSCKIATMKSLIKPSLHFFNIQLSQLFSMQGVLVLVGMMLGSVQIVIFSTIRTLINLIKQLLGMISHTLWPELTRIFKGENDRCKKVLYITHIRLTMSAATIMMLVLYYFGGDIYYLWLGGRVDFDSQLLNLFLVYTFQNIYWTITGNVLMATNNHHGMSYVMFISSCIILVASYFLLKYLDIYSVVIGMIVIEMLLPLWILSREMKKNNKWYGHTLYVRELLFPLIIVSSGVVSFYFAIILLPIYLITTIKKYKTLIMC